MQARSIIVAVVAMLLSAGAVQAAITIETVHVGDAGNAADTAAHSGNSAGQGSVSYEYNIAKYEVTAGQYTAFLNAVAKTDTYGLYSTYMWSDTYGCKVQRSGFSGSYIYSVAADYANRPVNCVSWGSTARFANWLANGQPTGQEGPTTTEDGSYYLNGATFDTALQAVARKTGATWVIPTEDEWYKAAYYSAQAQAYFDYPTQSYDTPGQDMADASGNNANVNVLPRAWPIDLGHYTTVAGEFQNSDSPYGTFDQCGNVWEWNEAIISGSKRGARGGAFDESGSLLLPAYRGQCHPSVISGDIGFRVVEIPEPATLAVLALGGIGLLRRRLALKG